MSIPDRQEAFGNPKNRKFKNAITSDQAGIRSLNIVLDPEGGPFDVIADIGQVQENR